MAKTDIGLTWLNPIGCFPTWGGSPLCRGDKITCSHVFTTTVQSGEVLEVPGCGPETWRGVDVEVRCWLGHLVISVRCLVSSISVRCLVHLVISVHQLRVITVLVVYTGYNML